EFIFMVEKFDKDHVIIGTQEGFYLFDGKTVAPVQTELDPYMSSLQVYHGSALHGGYFAITTLGQGVIVIDKNGKILHVLDQAVDFQDTVVHYAYQDRQGGLWLALNNDGIVRVDVPSQLTFYERSLGLEGDVRDIIRYDGALYVSTGTGLFVLESKSVLGGNGERSHFVRVPNVPQSWSLSIINDKLYVTSGAGIYVVKNKQAERLTNKFGYDIVAGKHREAFSYLGATEGLYLLNFEKNQWVTTP